MISASLLLVSLSTIVILQLVTGGHLLIFVTRSAGWFFPAISWGAIMARTA